MRMLRSAMVGMVLLTGAAGMVGEGGQMSGVPSPPVQLNPPTAPSTRGRRDIEAAEPPPEYVERQELSRNNDRQKRLVADTNKLLALATELKEQVNKTDKSAPQVDVVKKAEEIEKLAKSVRDRMKG